MIRVFRPDQTFAMLPAPLWVTAAELSSILARRFQLNIKSSLTLYLREKGTERRVAANEKPVLLTKRRFEQAGYTELDKLEELGREDNSYLCRLIYKPAEAPVPLTVCSARWDLRSSADFEPAYRRMTLESPSSLSTCPDGTSKRYRSSSIGTRTRSSASI